MKEEEGWGRPVEVMKEMVLLVMVVNPGVASVGARRAALVVMTLHTLGPTGAFPNSPTARHRHSTHPA